MSHLLVQKVHAVHAGKGYPMALGVPVSEGAGADQMFSAAIDSFRFGEWTALEVLPEAFAGTLESAG